MHLPSPLTLLSSLFLYVVAIFVILNFVVCLFFVCFCPVSQPTEQSRRPSFLSLILLEVSRPFLGWRIELNLRFDEKFLKNSLYMLYFVPAVIFTFQIT